MTYLTPEGIARRILSLYEDNYNTYLDTVEATWSATEDITLPDFETRRIVADPDRLDVIQQFPALAIGIGNIREDEDQRNQPQLYDSWYLLDVMLVYYLKALDSHRLGLMLLRHMEATMLFVNDHARLDYGNEVSIRNIRFLPSANSLPSDGNTLVKGLGVRFDVRFIQRGF